MDLMVVLWLGLSIGVGIIASARGRSGFGYFILSVLLSPLIGVLFAALLPPKPSSEQTAEAQRPRMRCASCAELVLVEAVKCKHCGADLTTQSKARCAYCSASVPPGATNCLGCGRRFSHPR